MDLGGGDVVNQLTDLTMSNLGLAIAVVASWAVVAGVLTSLISRSATKGEAASQSGDRGSKR